MARKGARKARQDARPREALVNAYTAAHGDYQDATVVDLNNELGGGRQKTYAVLRNLYPCIVDRWLAEGGPGFEEPERRAIDHCRSLWHHLGCGGNLVANLMATGGGTCGRERGLEQAEALAQLGIYETRIPRRYWVEFERVVRNGEAAGTGTLAPRRQEQITASKLTVGFVASLIAQWRGF